MRTDNEKAPPHAGTYAFDASDWHNEPECTVTLIANYWGGHTLFCSKHRCAANLEAVGLRLTWEASKKGAA